MPDGLRAAASGLDAQQARLDALANDIANVNTPGYRSQRIAFRDLAYDAVGGVELGTGAAATSVGRSDVAGSIVASDNPLDLAIDGSGYFQVKLADGRLALTRVGSLQVDASGGLVTTDGNQLVPPVTVPKGTSPASISIAQDGTVTAGGKKVGTIELVDVTAPGNLEPLGSSLSLPTTASGAPAATKAGRVLQGHIESSDVDLASTMVGLMDAQKAFDLASRAVKTQDELLEIANGIRR
jgi:flagellar basal-body rod protein FlgG